MKNWCWLRLDRGTTDDHWKQVFERMRQAGVHAILPEVFNNHAAWWASAHLPVAEALLDRLIPLAHAADLEIHAWMHTMACNIPEIYEGHPDWYDVNGKGESAANKPPYVGYYKFLCPSRPQVHEFLRRRVTELAAFEGLDGIHLDYIRFPDVILAEALQPTYDIVQDREYPEYDYCYCQLCRETFHRESGI
ncbi:MAG: family 10 glycosylhydrolase, partial [Gemmatimonadetes bacterium]|nr:family 10 glycosylhydrolase [Gemmatimonadota bacterium]